jgi:hypothetical protein
MNRIAARMTHPAMTSMLLSLIVMSRRKISS